MHDREDRGETMLRAGEEKINWYPGHMARARRQLAGQLGRVDVVVELCDARIPRASRNPDLDGMTAGKRRLLVLNKADLAEETPVGRLGSPEEIARTLVFLAAPEAGYITGQVIGQNGGLVI